MAILQIYSLTHLIRYFYGATWSTSRKGLFNWKEEQQGEYETLVKSFFDKERVIQVLNDFILFTRQDDELKKVVLRPHMDEYETLTRVFRILREAYDIGIFMDRDFSRKTARLVQEHTKSE
jgi:type I site-specific restriction-modification system R (restriction) subunit